MFAQSQAYERFMGRWSRLLAPQLIAFAGVKDHDVVLDVGAGTGSLARAVLETAKETRVVGVDPSTAYVDAALARGSDPRAQFEPGDAQHLRFADNCFHKALSLLVLNFIPNRDRALDEMIRVTHPGGVVAAAVWDYGDGMQMLRIFWDEAIALDPNSDAKDERHLPLCRRGELTQFWRVHGLLDVREQPLLMTMEFSSFDDYWSPFLGGQGPAGAYVAGLSAQERSTLKERLRRRLAGDGSDRPFQLTARAWAVRGKTPAARS